MAKSLARSTHRIAISNERLTSLHDGVATFAVRNNEQGGPRKRQERLPANDFIQWRRAHCIAPLVQPRISEFSHPSCSVHLIKGHGIFHVPHAAQCIAPYGPTANLKEWLWTKTPRSPVEILYLPGLLMGGKEWRNDWLQLSDRERVGFVQFATAEDVPGEEASLIYRAVPQGLA